MGRDAGRFEVFLQPGEYYFGDRDTRIRTLLGSCVSFTAWHPRLLIGAMSHYMLPRRRRRGATLDGRYGDEAVAWFIREAARLGTKPAEYEFKIFGGGDMFKPSAAGKKSIGQLNAGLGLGLFNDLGLGVVSRHLGGTGHRNVIFDIGTGDAWVRYVALDNAGNDKALAA